MAIDCDHPRPKLDLPGYIPMRMAWTVPTFLPGLPPDSARAIREALQGVYNELSRQGRNRNVIPLVEDLFVRPGSVVVGVANGQTVTLLPPGATGYTDPVTILLTDVVTPITVVRPDGTQDSLGTAGAYQYEPAGDGYETSPGGAILGGGIPTDKLLGRDSPGTGAVEFIGIGPGLKFDGAKTLDVRFPGAPIYDVMAPPFNAVGDGIADDTAAINAAIAAANATSGDVYLGARHRITAALTTVSGNNITVRGRGDFNGGSRIIIDSAAAIDVLVFTGQYSGVEDVWFVGIRVYTSGWAIRVRNAFRCRISRCVISQLCFGVEVFRSVLTYLDKVNIDDIYGVFSFWAGGDSGGENHAVTFRSCTYGTSMPGAIVGAGTAWATGTAYAVGAVVTANSGIYQAVQAGTSAAAGTGPSGIPGATNATVHTAQITDNTVRWVFAMPAAVGFLQSSYCHTFEMIDCGTLQGLYGFSMEDPANTGTSYPQFARARNLQIDHPTSRGVRLAAGGAARFDSTFITSVFGGSGIEVGSAFKGNWEFVGGEIFGCSEAGVIVNKGDGLLCGLQIGACGSASRDCIEVANSAARWSITGCSAGQMFASTTPASRYGLSIAAGCDHYVVEGNRFEGNVTGGILNTPGRSSTRAVLNNIPGVTIAGGSTWGLQIDATSPAVPLEITGAEQGENYRVDTRQTVSVSGTQDIILADDTTVLVLQLTADTTLRSLRTTATGDGRLVRIEHDSGAFTLTIGHNLATPTYLPFFNPNLADMQVTRGAIVTARSRSGFWRPEHTGTRMRVRKNSAGTVFDRGRFNVIEGPGMTLTVADDGPNDEVDLTFASSVVGVTDGDKGDITVTASGAVWTIDASAVTLAKMADLAQSRIIGRAEGAGTGVPQALTPTQVVAIIDAEDATWTGLHAFTGSTHTVGTTGDVSVASASGGLWMSAGHTAVAPPSVSNGDVLISASSGVSVYAGATPVTGVAANEVLVSSDGAVNLTSVNITLTATNVAATTTNNIGLTAGAILTLAAGTSIDLNSPHNFANTTAMTSITTSVTTSNDNVVVACNVLRLSTGGSDWELTGMVPQRDCQLVYIVNAATVVSVIRGQSLSSSAANRFSGADRLVPVGRGVWAWYDGTLDRWITQD